MQNFAKMRRVCVSAGEGCCKWGLLSPQVAVAGLRLGECRQNLNGCIFLWSLRESFWNNVEVTLMFKDQNIAPLHQIFSSSNLPLSLSLWFDSIKHDNAVFLAMPILEFWLSWSLPSKRRSVLLWNVSWKFNTQRLIRKRYPICQQLSHGNSPGSEVSTLVVRAVSAHWVILTSHSTRLHGWSMFKSMCQGWNASSSILAGPGLTHTISLPDLGSFQSICQLPLSHRKKQRHC